MNSVLSPTVSNSDEPDTSNFNSSRQDGVAAAVQDLMTLGFSPLPVAPAQDPHRYPLKKNGAVVYQEDGKTPKPLFNGKNPSYIDENGTPRTVAHTRYRGKLPTTAEIQEWFSHPSTGIGTNGGAWLDFDLKKFNDPDHLEATVAPIIERANWVERTQGGGYRVAVALEQKPEFTNFGVGDVAHAGELLNGGGFVVLAPTKGERGEYHRLKFGPPLKVSTVDELGIRPSKTARATAEPPKLQAVAPPNVVMLPGVVLRLEQFASKKIAAIIGGKFTDDRSEDLVKVARELYGWENIAKGEGISVDSADSIIHAVAELAGVEDKLERILKGVNRDDCEPGLAFAKGLGACKDRLLKATSKGIKTENEGDPFCVEKSVEQHVFERFFESGKGSWAVINQGFYRYTGEGYWQHVDDAKIEKLLSIYLMKCYRLVGKELSPVHNVATDKAVVSAFKFARKALSTEPNREQSSYLRCFANGTLNTKTGELRGHQKEDYLTSRIDSMFISGRPCPEKFQEFVQSSFGLENLPLVRANISMMLDPSAPWGHFLYIVGQSGGGKGTLIRFIQSLFDKDNVRSGNTFADISTPEGRHQYLRSAALYCFPDMGGYVQGVRAFYELVDNGALSGRPLYNSTTYHERFNTRFIVASVEPLSIENAGDGWERRAIVLPVIPGKRKKDPTLEQQLMLCKSDVISWALSMGREERDYLLLNSETASESAAEAKRSVTMTGDSVRQFIDLCLRPAPAGEGATLAQLHDWYRVFSKSFGYSDMGASKLGARIQSIIPASYEPRRKMRSGEPGYGPNKFCPAQYNVVDMPGLFNISDMGALTIEKAKTVDGGLDAFCPVSDDEVSQALTDCQGWGHYCGVVDRYGKEAIEKVWVDLPVEIIERITAFQPGIAPPGQAAEPTTETEPPASIELPEKLAVEAEAITEAVRAGLFNLEFYEGSLSAEEKRLVFSSLNPAIQFEITRLRKGKEKSATEEPAVILGNQDERFI